MDKRLFEIECWVKETLGINSFSLEPASSDASFRRYFRVESEGESLIVMDAPPDKENISPFIHAANTLASLGLSVPRVRHRCDARGLLIIDDLGTRLYLDELDEKTANVLYPDAIDALISIQSGPGLFPDVTFPAYDDAMLVAEMELFDQWYVRQHLEVSLDPGQEQILQESIEFLSKCAREQPQTWVHRDYHSRNLMVLPEKNPGIIDFQDMVVGPITYDLVSLLKDCYICWPRARVNEWIDYYLDRVTALNPESNFRPQVFTEWFDLMGAQRHLKVLGIFARLNYRDGKAQYIDDLPLVLSYLIETCAQYPVLASLHRLLLELHPDEQSG